MTQPARQLAVRISADLKARVDAAVAALKHIHGPSYTLREATEEALTDWVQAAENQHNEGQPWPPPEGGLDAGRPRHRPPRPQEPS
ncbi:hypothetical protein CGZ98_06220 [Enemella evansiae]|uniref:hypothetical protein n=1 Tax=Enemella evansiae TaxID=2016499 RepID=UPI000B97BF7F|nr:hypothetical protein [Enemella evansiae]OYO13137.1 hypothetical protein CGZ98_06220 [Enemella evansiae]